MKQQKTCVICKNDIVPRYHPFCSKKCADIDLGRWFDGQYVIAGQNLLNDESEMETSLSDELRAQGHSQDHKKT